MEINYKRTKLSPVVYVPVELIQHIQSFLPAKEAARTCILSKSWLHAWQTIPTVNFRSFPGLRYKNFMNHTLLRYQSNNIPIQSFDFQIKIYDKETASLAENWIRHVSDPKTCTKELSFDILLLMDLLTLPLEIFSSENLKSVTVATNYNGGVKFFNSLSSNPVMIKCVSLRVLDLKYISVTDTLLANLLSTCKLLEKISLVFCRNLKTIEIKNLAFLRELKLHLQNPNTILEITNVPVLRMFDHSLAFLPRKPMPFQMDSLGSLKQLIIGDVLMDDEFFNTINSKLPLLESLTLKIGDEKSVVKNMVISIFSLKRLNLAIYTSTSKQFVIAVCAPKLISCVCEYGRKPTPVIWFAPATPTPLTLIRS